MESEKFRGKSTEELVSELMERGMALDIDLVNEIAARKDAAGCLRYWLQYRSERGWAAIHAIHLLGMIKTRESFDALCYALVNRQEALSDWLTEAMPGLLAGFGPEYLPDLERVFAMESLDEAARGVATDAISAIGWKHPEARGKAVSFLKGVVEREGNPYLVADAICELGDLHEASAVPVMEKAFEDKRVDEDVIRRSEAVRQAKGELDWGTPGETLKRCEGYFTKENFEYLQGVNDESEEKQQGVAKNALCPCGSGKRYKKCCMGKDSASA